MRYTGNTYCKYDSYNVDSAGVPTLATTGESWQEYPIYVGNKTETYKGTDLYYRIKLNYLAPARRAGEVADRCRTRSIRSSSRAAPGSTCRASAASRPRPTSPTTRRTPAPPARRPTTTRSCSTARWTATTSSWSARRRCTSRTTRTSSSTSRAAPQNVLKPKHVNPDLERWELHRVWVVEATLKEGKRHIYAKRVFYVDEDTLDRAGHRRSTTRAASSSCRSSCRRRSATTPLAPTTSLQMYYNFIAGDLRHAGHVRPATRASLTTTACPRRTGRRRRWLAPACASRRHASDRAEAPASGGTGGTIPASVSRPGPLAAIQWDHGAADRRRFDPRHIP